MEIGLFVGLALSGLVACGDGGGVVAGPVPPSDGGDGGPGPGDGGGDTPASAALTITWEQPEREQPVLRGVFGRTLPAAVRALRIIYTRDDGAECCVSIDPRADAFPAPDSRSLVLDALPPGNGVMSIHGFAVDVAPSDGVDDLCSIAPRSAASACNGDMSEAPSYGVDPFAVVIAGGSNNLGVVEIPALPFVIDRTPGPGEVLRTPSSVSFGIVDAAGSVASDSVAIEIDRGEGFADLDLDDLVACNDRGSGDPDCSQNGELEVRGFLVETSAIAAGTGPLRVRVIAANNEAPASTLDTVYEASTVPRDVDITFRLDDDVVLGSLGFDIDYSGADGEFAGRSDQVQCDTLAAVELAVYNDIDDARAVLVRFADTVGFRGPTDLARCRFRNFDSFPEPGDFRLRVVDATDPAAVAVVPDPGISISAIEVPQ